MRTWRGAHLAIGLLPLALACDELPACADCRIELEQNVVLESQGIAMIGSRIAMDSSGNYLMVRTVDPHRIAEFDSAGLYIGSFGTEGGGPGELRSPSVLAAGRGGLVFVVDGSSIVAFDSARQYAGSMRVQGIVTELFALPGARLFGHVPSLGRRGSPTMFVTGPSDSSLHYFAVDSTTDRYDGVREIALRGSEMLSIGKLNPDVRVFDVAGQMTRAFDIQRAWFEESSPGPDVAARVMDAVVDSAGRLWLLAGRENEDWEPPSGGSQGESRPVALTPAEFGRRWDQRIDVIDTESERILASYDVGDLALSGFAGPGLLVELREDGMEIDVVIWRARLSTPESIAR